MGTTTSQILHFNHGRIARWRKWRACDVGEAKEGVENELWRRWSSAHSPTFPSLHLSHNSFSKPSVALPTSQFILQPFASRTSQALHLIQSRAHSPNFPSLHLRHNSFSNPLVASPTSQFILQPFASPTSRALHLIQSRAHSPTFRHFTYIATHSPNLPSLYLRHSSFSNPSVASLTSQLVLQPFFRFSYVTDSSLNVTSRVAHGLRVSIEVVK